MFCPTCQSQNEATSVRCIQCGATLIYEAEGHSANYKRGAAMVDRRIFSGIGALLGWGFAFLMINTILESTFINARHVYLAGIIGGAIVGQTLAWLKWRHS